MLYRSFEAIADGWAMILSRGRYILLLVVLTLPLFCEQRPAKQNGQLQACAVLRAQLTDSTAHSRTVSANPDTLRIQAALDVCSPGKAVVLLNDGQRRAFLSAPLRLLRGVTLYVGPNVTLY